MCDESGRNQSSDEYEEYLEYEKWLASPAFERVVLIQHVQLKRKLDCGHTIDGGEPYRYFVWRDNSDERGVIHQRTDCEFCARKYNTY